jgi:hypothetical protein
MKIDQHPFAVNMVEISEKKGMGKTKVLTSQSAKESRSVDPSA